MERHTDAEKTLARLDKVEESFNILVDQLDDTGWANYSDLEDDPVLGEKFAEFRETVIGIYLAELENGTDADVDADTITPPAVIEAIERLDAAIEEVR